METYKKIEIFARECGVDEGPCGVVVSEKEDGSILVADDYHGVAVEPVATLNKIEKVDRREIETADKETRRQIFWQAIVDRYFRPTGDTSGKKDTTFQEYLEWVSRNPRIRNREKLHPDAHLPYRRCIEKRGK